MQEKVVFRNSEGLELVGVLHSPEKRKETGVIKKGIGVIICHGFTGNKDRNFIPELASDLEENGFLTLRFDFSGNGESGGKFEDVTLPEYMEDLKSAVDFLKKRVGKICVVGHSMGGNVAILEYSKYRDFDFMVLLAPGIEIISRRFTDEHMKTLDRTGYLEFVDYHGEKRRISKRHFDVRRNTNLIKMGKFLRIPTLTILGETDKSVSNEKCIEFHNSIKAPKRLEMLKGENHTFHNRAEKITHIILDFLINNTT